MGFRVTVRKNGAMHGESHYTSEAVAAGMVAKMRDAGADVSVARCNGSGCGCDGAKSNPRRNGAITSKTTRTQIEQAEQLVAQGDFEGAKKHIEAVYKAAYAAWPAKWAQAAILDVGLLRRACEKAGVVIDRVKANPKAKPKEPPVWEREGHSQRNPRRNGKKFKMPPKPPANAEAVAAARAVGQTAYARGIGSAPAQDPMLRPLIGAHPNDFNTIIGIMDAWKKEWEKAYHIATDAEVAKLGIFPKSNPRRNGAAKLSAHQLSALAWIARYPGTDASVRRVGVATADALERLGLVTVTRELVSERFRITPLSARTGTQMRFGIAVGVTLTDAGRAALKPLKPNGTTAANLAASRSMSHRFGLSRNPSMDAETASTLIKQLGGSGKLVAMVGAKDFMRTERNGHPALSFKFKGSTKANYVNIALDPSDTYTLQFGKIVKYDLKPTGEIHGVYADQLKRTFEKFTGLYLSL